MKYLIVVDMQNDFIDGTFGTPEAVAILPHVKEKIENFEGKVLFTRDTHAPDYLSTQEGRNLPVEHCIKGTDGWQIHPSLEPLRKTDAIDKPTFGSTALMEFLKEEKDVESLEFIGLCTDICVISNAILAKATFLEVPVTVDAKCCAGVTPQSHKNALEAMKMCQIRVINE